MASTASVDVEDDLLSYMDIENYFKQKLIRYCEESEAGELSAESNTETSATSATPEASVEESNASLENELLEFLNDVNKFKKTEAVVVLEEDDSDSESSSDFGSSSSSHVGNEDFFTTIGSDASSTVQTSVDAGPLSLLDMDNRVLEAELKELGRQIESVAVDQVKVDDPSSGRRLDTNNEPNQEVTPLATKFVKCKFCFVPFEVVDGNFMKSLAVHQQSEYHKKMDAERKAKGRPRESKITDESNKLSCTLCGFDAVTNQELLLHIQSKKHKVAQTSRFEKTVNEEEDKPESTKQEEVKPIPQVSDKLTFAMGMNRIRPVSPNQFQCTMCNKMISPAKDIPTLMKNIAYHIQSRNHVAKLSVMEEKLKTIMQNPNVKEQREEMRKDKETIDGEKRKVAFQFICLLCNLTGFGYQYCKTHMSKPAHMEKVPTGHKISFTDGAKCQICKRIIFGLKVEVDHHKRTCTDSGPETRRSRNRGGAAQKNKNSTGDPGKPHSRSQRKLVQNNGMVKQAGKQLAGEDKITTNMKPLMSDSLGAVPKIRPLMSSTFIRSRVSPNNDWVFVNQSLVPPKPMSQKPQPTLVLKPAPTDAKPLGPPRPKPAVVPLPQPAALPRLQPATVPRPAPTPKISSPTFSAPPSMVQPTVRVSYPVVKKVEKKSECTIS